MGGSIQSNLLCGIFDGMDQAHFKVPRVLDEHSKLFQKLFRPPVHVLGGWIHRFMFNFVCSDPDLKKDATTQIEVIMRCLSDVVDQHSGLPLGFVCQQDNCPREGKNTFVWSALLLLVVLDVFRYTMADYLRTGHSHADIDGNFGHVSGHIARHEFGSIDELVSLLDTATKPIAKADSLRKSSLQDGSVRRHSRANKLDETADWKLWQNHLGIKFKGIRV